MNLINDIDKHFASDLILEKSPVNPTLSLKFQATQIGYDQFQMDQKMIDLFVSKLNNRGSPQGVRFKFSHESTPQLRGVCSAMTIRFLDLCVFKGTVYQSHIQAFESSFSRPKPIDAHIQSAFDRIVKSEIELSPIDFRRAKIDALLGGFGLKVAAVFEEIDLNDLSHAQKFNAILTSILPGFYFIRSIHYTLNEKGEIQGHSTAFVKQGSSFYFYDPNLGVIELPSDSAGAALYTVALQNHKKFDIPLLTIYRVERDSRITFSFDRVWQAYQMNKLKKMIADLDLEDKPEFADRL